MYCTKCGKKNDDDAKFCNSCGTSLTGEVSSQGRERDNRCDEDCSGHRPSHTFIYFWVALLFLIILAIIFFITVRVITLTSSNIVLPHWMVDFPYSEICPLTILLILLCVILSAVVRAIKRH